MDPFFALFARGAWHPTKKKVLPQQEQGPIFGFSRQRLAASQLFNDETCETFGGARVFGFKVFQSLPHEIADD